MLEEIKKVYVICVVIFVYYQDGRASLTADGKEPVVWERLKGTEGAGTPG